jgi:hypothetical protein
MAPQIALQGGETDVSRRPEAGCKELVLSAVDGAQHKKTIVPASRSNCIPVSRQSIGDSVLRFG